MLRSRALAVELEVMLFDEPTYALDPELVGEVLRIMQELAQEGHTTIFVTHEMGLVRHASTRVVFLHGGKIEEQGKPEQVFDNPQSDAPALESWGLTVHRRLAGTGVVGIFALRHEFQDPRFSRGHGCAAGAGAQPTRACFRPHRESARRRP